MVNSAEISLKVSKEPLKIFLSEFRRPRHLNLHNLALSFV